MDREAQYRQDSTGLGIRVSGLGTIILIIRTPKKGPCIISASGSEDTEKEVQSGFRL